MNGDLVSILDGNTFVVSDGRGDIEGSPSEPTGLFSLDTRYLSRWVMTLDGQRLTRLSADDLQYYQTRFFLVPGFASHYADAKVSVIRQREIGGTLRERVTILNHDEKPLRCTLRLEAGADFADLFEIKDEALDKKGEYYARVEPDLLRLGYHREHFRRETLISSSEPVRLDEQGLSFELDIEAGGEWSTELLVETKAVGPGGRDLRMGVHAHGPGRGSLGEDLREWLAAAPSVTCECTALTMAYERSLADLAALRFSPLSLAGQALPAAGLPWFMTMFGRDSILTCLQTLGFTPQLSTTCLRILAALQGTRFDDFRDEDPGKILHEFRYGETAAFEDQPHTPYYGAADSTSLFVILLDEYERWSGDVALVRELEFE
ncbi:glycogen debranching N-terminal domain-containing protein, partial [Plantactinospora siamensis]